MKEKSSEKKKAKKKEKSNELTSQNRLEEYKQLRAEIRHYLDRRSLNIKFAITITLGVIGIGLELKNYLMFYAAFTLIWILWYDEIRRIKAVFRTAAYIEIIIEKELSGLTWETLGGKHSIQTGFFERLIANATYPILLVLNGLTGYFVMVSEHTTFCLWFKIFVLLIQFLLILTLVLISHKVSTKGRKNEIDEWRRIISDKE